MLATLERLGQEENGGIPGLEIWLLLLGCHPT
jgi:hypothetical protein